MKFDASQIAIIKQLDSLAQRLVDISSDFSNHRSQRSGNKNFSNLFKNFLLKFLTFINLRPKHHITPQSHFGYYIYGDVGRGKTMIMQNFYHKIINLKKNYFHFNNFMLLIHQNLHSIRQENSIYQDELHEAVSRVINDSQLICFDEFQVVDVADAMPLARIFEYFFNHSIIVIATSNSHPLDLYPNGLQREIFIKFVNEVLLKNLQVLNLNSNIDYRKHNRSKIVKRFLVNNHKNREIFKEIINNFTAHKTRKTIKIKVWERDIKIKKAYENIAIFNFDDLFTQNYSTADFKALCSRFELIFIKKLPRLSSDNINEIRRFTLFIDEVYENKTLLIILSKINMRRLNDIAVFAPYFARTLSRLHEIISDQYWNQNYENKFK